MPTVTQRRAQRSAEERAAKGETGGRAARAAKKREAQDRVLALLAQGHTITEAMTAVKRKRDCFYQWGRDEPWFKDRADAIRSREPGEHISPFTQFREDYFGFKTPSHQAKIIKAIDEAKPGSITMILLPPGAGKTSCLEDYICYLLGPVDPNHRISVLSETRDHARKVLRRVANRMVDTRLSPAYIRGFGPFRAPDRETSKPWNADILTVLTAQHDERDYSLEVRSAGSAIYGARYDLIVLDDFQSVRSLSATDKLVEYFRQDVYTRAFSGSNRGKIIIIGTRVGPDDFYERLLREDMVDTLVRIPALDEEGHSYWPFTGEFNDRGEKIGFEEQDLADIKKVVGDETWSRVYMQEPQSKSGQTFSDQMIEDAKDHGRGIDKHDIHGTFRIGSLDPAIAGHASFKIGGIEYERMYLLDTLDVNNAGRYETLWDHMEQFTVAYKPNVWVIEGNNIQNGLLRSDRVEEMQKKYGFVIVSHQTGRNKMDDIIGVGSMASAFLRNEIRIPWGTPEAREKFTLLCEQLRRWRADIPTKQLVQDEVMSLWFLYLEWQRQKVTLASRLDRHLVKNGLPWRPTGYKFVRAGRG